MLLSQKILKWFDKYGRHDLPWQTDPTPYRVWVSEIMLQQTQVSTVIPYFKRFIEHFPNITTLAKANLDSVLYLWSGLGYYARAKNLHKTAQILQKKYQAKFPLEHHQVIELPGIGRSTAGAILAISALQRHPILDGNVKRVLSRHFAIAGERDHPKVIEKLWALSEEITPQKRVNHYTQAIMDLGATICTRNNPKCSDCPIAKTCKALKLQRVHDYPPRRTIQKKPIKSVMFLMFVHAKSQRILLEKRPIKGIWGGLWSLPECSINTDVLNWCDNTYNFSIQKYQYLQPFRHSFTHFHLNIHPVLCQLKDTKPNIPGIEFEWYTWNQIQTLGLPAPIKRMLAKNIRTATFET